MFSVALCTKAKLWKQPRCPKTDNGLRKCGVYKYIYNGVLFSHKEEQNYVVGNVN
jgi:hypothetical protein